MSRVGLVVLLAITLMGAGCGYGSHNYMNGTGMARISQLSPSNIPAGGSAFTLTVTGTGFGTDALVYWGASPLNTTPNSASQVTAEVTAADITNAGMVQVYVHSGGANSNTMSFTIQ